MPPSLRYSRPAATAARLGAAAADAHRFLDKRVLLTGEIAVLRTDNGWSCFLDSLRLLVRICRNVAVYVPDGHATLLREARRVAESIAFEEPVEFLPAAPAIDGYDAILSVGTQTFPNRPWTVINANGWLARVSSGATDLPGDCTQPNPMACLAAASLGVAEVFKRLLAVKPERGPLLDAYSFSLYSYETGTLHAGPKLPERIDIGVLLVAGAGAIGNGIAHLLHQIRVSGQVLVVDRQAYGEENLGTSLLVGPADVGKAKALTVEKMLKRHVSVRGFVEELAAFRERLGSEVPYPRIVLNGLDNIEARHEVQRIWPDHIVDGAIGDFGCQVSCHPWRADTACILCLFREMHLAEPAEHQQSQATGLSIARVRQPEDLVTEADVLAAPAERQAWLRAQVGRQVCSVVQEGVAQVISSREQREGFQPSAPFVACLSAAMVVGELVKIAAGLPSPLEPRFQMDVLQGPGRGQLVPQERRRDCVCATRTTQIEILHQRRRTRAT